ncbi:hypothetical protein D3C86_1338390 [compost metagenome]
MAPTSIGNTDHQGIGDARILVQYLLDLFGEDLLAASVDALRTATQHNNTAILLDPRHVASVGAALALDQEEGLGAFLRVAEIAQGHMPYAHQHTALTRPDKPAAVFGHHSQVGARRQADETFALGRFATTAQHAAFGRAHAVGDFAVGQQRPQAFLDM